MSRQARRPEGPPPPPVVQRVRLRYAKRGRLRFSSHRDFARALERALRRSGAPVALSAGFHPHPKVSYVGAAPTGTASEAEYLEVALAERRDPEELRTALDAALPAGLDVLEAVEALPGTSLAERVQASRWEVHLRGLADAELAPALAHFLAAPEVPVEKRTRSGRASVDARAAVVSATTRACALPDHAPPPGGAASAGGAPAPGGCAILAAVVRHTTPAVRPDDVLTGLRAVSGLTPPVPPAATRLAQGLLVADGLLADPLGPDRQPAPPPGERPDGPRGADVGVAAGREAG